MGGAGSWGVGAVVPGVAAPAGPLQRSSDGHAYRLGLPAERLVRGAERLLRLAGERYVPAAARHGASWELARCRGLGLAVRRAGAAFVPVRFDGAGLVGQPRA